MYFINISGLGKITKPLTNVLKSKKKNTERAEPTMSFDFLNLKNKSLESKTKISKFENSTKIVKRRKMFILRLL